MVGKSGDIRSFFAKKETPYSTSNKKQKKSHPAAAASRTAPTTPAPPTRAPPPVAAAPATTTTAEIAATENAKPKNFKWCSELQVVAVNAWLTKCERKRLDPSDGSAKSLIAPTVKFLKREHPVTFQHLKISNLSYWVKKYLDGGSSLDALRTDGRQSGGGHHRLVPKDLEQAIDEHIQSLIASKIPLNASLLRPFLLKFIREHDDGKYSHVLEGDRKFTCSKQWIRNLLDRHQSKMRRKNQALVQLKETNFYSEFPHHHSKHGMPPCKSETSNERNERKFRVQLNRRIKLEKRCIIHGMMPKSDNKKIKTIRKGVSDYV